MKKRIFTDFDGPIMDVSERYYQVYLYCLDKIRKPHQVVTTLPKTEFWELKRSQVPEKEIAKISGFADEKQSIAFAHLRRATVHTDPYFEHDQLIESAIPALEKAKQSGVDLAVMTMRRRRELEPVLDKYDLRRFFASDRIFCLDDDYIKTVDTQDKPKLMKLAQANLPEVQQQWMIGDTEADIIAAQTYDVPVIGVLSGIRNQAQLEKYKPNQILPNLLSSITKILNP
ncbi:HAD family hydrolase [Phormidium tenue]|jgi:phosphoglycolate phosphatase-like HAD superfamily hydrolase|uniref:HAD family hydrolase n=1 Tax=Phormidium tenue FACHB-1050 TaxID=2692857 RepID=A0ABR8CBT5_9CYAN|nr:HAD family hydrolase [Phormidium tenue]MBD2318129.1 HAD family hydrolase [Phormidium tenue FACHB-1050]